MKRIEDEIRKYIPKEELLCQLAEECAELSKASLKLRRVYDGKNPTPISLEEARENFFEELADVMLLICLMTDDNGEIEGIDIDDMDEIRIYKLNRWVNRLKEARGDI